LKINAMLKTLFDHWTGAKSVGSASASKCAKRSVAPAEMIAIDAEVDTTEMTDETETDEDDLDHDRAIDDEEHQAIHRRETVPKLRRENPAAIPALDPDPAAPVRTNYTPADTFVQNVATLTSLEISLPRGL
jgi:hypothetical protein